jgi:hypothetical protein
MPTRPAEEPERWINWKRPSHDYENDERNRPYSWGGWMGVYMKRWQYWPPWTCSYWWKFTWMDACDGERASKLAVVPLLGGFVWFFNRPCGHQEED